MFQLLTQQLRTCKGNRLNAVVVVGKQSGKINYRYSHTNLFIVIYKTGDLLIYITVDFQIF